MWPHPELSNAQGDQAAAGFSEKFEKQHWSDGNGQLLIVRNSRAVELRVGGELHLL